MITEQTTEYGVLEGLGPSQPLRDSAMFDAIRSDPSCLRQCACRIEARGPFSEVNKGTIGIEPKWRISGGNLTGETNLSLCESRRCAIGSTEFQIQGPLGKVGQSKCWLGMRGVTVRRVESGLGCAIQLFSYSELNKAGWTEGGTKGDGAGG